MSEFLKRTWTEIHLDRLQGNFQAIQASLAPGSQAMAVVKADGYGHGAAAAAKAMREAGAAWFGVSNLEEAVQLRRAGIDGDILILSFTPPEEAGRLAEFAVTQTVLSRPYAEELDAAGPAAGGGGRGAPEG
ncbi:alanine racemase, partial [Ruminococcus sp.]|uniref:alanine racemase n=1 Tax=Ruminococcus sp. TaxID=41978 RepID=UPI003AF5092E